MARSARQWDNLKPDYRARLTRGGISKTAYMRGDNLQTARGQTKERKPHKSGESPSVVRSWKARALKRGVTPEDWKTAITTSPFYQVKNAIVGLEQAHKAFVNKGAPNAAERRRLKQERKYSAIEVSMANRFQPPADDDTYDDVEYYDDGYGDNEAYDYQGLIYEEVDTPIEWGDSWGYYH